VLPTKNKVSEILVLGEKQPHLARREVDNIHVAQTCGSLRNVSYVMTGRAQKTNQRRCDAFVSKPTHASAVDDFFVGEIVGSKCLRGVDIVKREPGMIPKDHLGRYASA